MAKTVKGQIVSGLRLGGFLAVFLLAGMLVGDGLRRIGFLDPARHYQIDWVGFLEIGIAVPLLVGTAHVWVQLVAGAVLLGIFKSVLVIASGYDVFPSYAHFGRSDSVILALYLFASLLLLVRFARNQPTVLDRIALTIFLLCLWPASDSIFSLWQGGGLLGLVIAWLVFRLGRTSQVTSRGTLAH
jgi:hypothetical protein